MPAQVCFSEVIMATAYQKDGKRRFTNEHANDIRMSPCKRSPFNEGGLEQNRQHSKSDRRAELSCFLALLDAAHS